VHELYGPTQTALPDCGPQVPIAVDLNTEWWPPTRTFEREECLPDGRLDRYYGLTIAESVNEIALPAQRAGGAVASKSSRSASK
jgi:hypothetical protein